MATLPAPTNALVSIVNTVIDTLIKGLGVEVAISLATAEAPWLATPIVSWLFRKAVEYFAGILDSNIKNNVDIVIIRFQNDIRKAEYDKAMEPIKAGKATDDDIKKAREAIDRLVNRSKP